KGFVSEENIQTSDPVMNNTSLRVVGSFQIPKLPRIRLDLRGEREYRDSGNDVINIDTISSFAIGTKFRFTQNFNYDFDRSQSNPDARNKLFASTLINYRLSNKVSLRGDISYSIDPTEELNSSSLSFDYRLNQGFSYSASVNHIFESSSANQSRTSYTLNLNKSFNRYILSIGGDYDDTGAYGFNANIAFSFGYDPKYQTGTLTGLSIARNGAVSTKVYLDENNNGAFEEEDMPLEDIGFTIDGRDATETTNEDGAALIANLPVGKPQKIDIKADGLPDPYWIPRKVKNHIILHSGVVGFMEFPIIPTGEVDGTVWIYEEGKLKEASNVNIELLDVDGNLIQTVKTSYDGFYLMTYVPYGQYRLRVDQEQLARLGLENGDIYEIALNNDNPIETGNDFIINRVGRDLLPEMYEAGLEEAKPVEEEEKVAVLPLDKAPQIPRKAPVKAKKPKAEEPAIIDDQPYYVVVIKRDDISQGDVDPRAIRRNLREIKNLQYPDMIKVSKRLQVKEKLVEGEYIVIAKGDRAMSLVEKYNLDRKELIKIDDIKNPYIVQIGNRMYLRDAAEFLQADAKMDERRKAKFKDFAKNLAIITRKGEDIASLAKKYKVDKQDLIEANNLQFPYQIKPGQKLYLGKKEERIIDKRKDKISLNNRGRIIADFIRNSDIMTIPNRFKIDGDNVIPLGSLKIPDIVKPIADKVLD
ncbi:MAG: LysM peptidoglycan-binding domain-containing protein, partial [Proteobacteria bacterium]|nr:LysM peptidoglycan-binding domain-containing protein [Pseudomonadota bacterium]